MPDDHPSNARIDRVGEKLKRGEPLTPQDESVLESVFVAHDLSLSAVVARLQGILDEGNHPLEPSSRVKTRTTLLEKLKRESVRLSQVQDIAGARLIVLGGHKEQDGLTEKIRTAFDVHSVVDRRINPSHGYRAVHVVVRLGDCLVEVQIRTLLHHLWTEVFERLSDEAGRGIRYGDVPDSLQVLVAALIGISYSIAHLYDDGDGLALDDGTLVTVASAPRGNFVAALIDLFDVLWANKQSMQDVRPLDAQDAHLRDLVEELRRYR